MVIGIIDTESWVLDRAYGCPGTLAAIQAAQPRCNPVINLSSRLWRGLPPRRCVRVLAQCRRGVAAVEFALVLPIRMLLLFGMISGSAAFLTWGMMQGSSQYGARIMSTGTVKNNSAGAISTSNTTATVTCSSSLSSSDVEYYACSNLPAWASFTVTTTENCAVPSVKHQRAIPQTVVYRSPRRRLAARWARAACVGRLRRPRHRSEPHPIRETAA